MIRIGTSGWQYDSWRGRFYPAELPTTRWLAHYASRFPAVEVNATFYRMPSESTVQRWHDQTPADFRVAAKLSRYVTHVRKLADSRTAIATFVDRLAPLGSRLGPVLVQLPPTLTAEPRLLDEALAAFPSSVHVAVEPRHPSWFSSEVKKILEAHDAALCIADRGSRLMTPLWCTASWAYIRLHHGRATPASCYGRSALHRWADRIEALRGHDVFVFFNNDTNGCAPANATTLCRLVTSGTSGPRRSATRNRGASR